MRYILMQKFLKNLIMASLIAGSLAIFGNVASVHAASINTVIRGPSDQTVYWYANDGKRYVFPNSATYFTWYPSFNNVLNVSSQELAAIPLGGNVTYRPGAKLVKITTDPKVYAVSRGGILRHVISESLAIQLYGANWATQVNDVPDTFFSNYTVGTPIYSTADYNVSNEYNGVFNPGDSMRSMGQNFFTQNTQYNTQTNTLTLTADRTSITNGQAVYLTGIYNGTLPSGGRLEIKDVRNNNVIKTCYDTSVCNVTVYPTVDSSQSSAQYYIVASYNNGTQITTQYSPVIYTNGYTQTGTLTINADRTNITNGQAVYISTSYDTNLPTGGRMEIKEVRTNNVIKTCYDASSCSVTVYPYQTGYSSTQYYVVALNASGSQIATQYGPTIYFNGSTTQVDTFTLTADRTSINSGETVRLSANAYSSYSSNYTGYRIEIRDVRTGSIVRTCYDQSSCITDVSIVYGNSSAQYEARIYNNGGSLLKTQLSPIIYVNNYTGSTNSYYPTVTFPTDGQVLTNYPRTLNITWNSSARRHQVEINVNCINVTCRPVTGIYTNPAILSTDNYQNSVATQLNGDSQFSVRIRAINDDGSYGIWSTANYFYFNTAGAGSVTQF